ncbi:mannose-P-dolichol utilization defect 1 protein homolog 2-like isoform X1 [Lycium barbarum]|uniref:mannose-P-dolichol utilization defect 1 protein homolog 2-like isoform X1 n=1 Tax=Lycium barbarum TaxID=112863 RepID=UPI00293EFCE7|nr:mannose-P-dolichol utilization defect 1 protein homolog 2-like isoform X1 [Lycium barbarum]
MHLLVNDYVGGLSSADSVVLLFIFSERQIFLIPFLFNLGSIKCHLSQYFLGLWVGKILKILRHKSVRGLSVVSFELEVIGYTIALAYCLHKGLPFSAFGEYAFLLIQAIILVAIIYYFSQPLGTKTWIRGLLYCAIAPIVLAGQIDPILFEALYASQHAIFLFARIPQIWKNFKNRSTGELSLLTFFMNFGGSMIRVFTSLQEKAPMSVVMGSVIGVVMNGTILSQILLYQAPAPKKGKKTD